MRGKVFLRKKLLRGYKKYRSILKIYTYKLRKCKEALQVTITNGMKYNRI